MHSIKEQLRLLWEKEDKNSAQNFLEILKRFREMNFKKAIVSTNEHEFFYPAQKMYLACGSREIRRFWGAGDRDYVMIEYERALF